MVIATGPAEVGRFKAVFLKSALKLYRDTGMKANRAYTPSNMLAMAGRITGQSFKRGQYTQAIDALETWLAR